MALKVRSNHHKFIFLGAQMAVLGIAMAALFWLMVSGNKERIVNDLKAKLDASTQAMATQLKANQVPFSASNVEPGVLIINLTDGSIVIDHRDQTPAAQKLWQGYKTKIIYEMQKQKHGWIEYPDKSSWSFNEPRRLIRYISLDELNWILALEDRQPGAWDLLKESVNPSACLTIFFIFIIGSFFLTLITLRYFDLISKQISDTLETDLLSLNGEEKLWGKHNREIPKMKDMKKDPGFEFSVPKIAVPQQASPVVEDPIMEEIFQKPPAAMTAPVPSAQAPLPAREILKATAARGAESNDTASVDVAHIHSPVLKKILQQFRGK